MPTDDSNPDRGRKPRRDDNRNAPRGRKPYGPKGGGPGGGGGGYRKPPLRIQPTTLWDYPSQHYGDEMQGDREYKGATPSYIIWNLLKRYTREGHLVVDPCAGSGTTLDVARDGKRRALGYDVNPTRDDIFNVDARHLPEELSGKVDFVFIDPPYSTHIDYSDDPRCIGKLDAHDPEGAYFEAMRQVIGEIHRVLKPGAHMALYVSDSYDNTKGFVPIGFELFAMLREKLTPIDIVSVVRHNRTLEMGNYRRAAEEGNFFLRGFNYLFIMQKAFEPGTSKPQKRELKGEVRAAGKDAGGDRRRVGKATSHQFRKDSKPGKPAGKRPGKRPPRRP